MKGFAYLLVTVIAMTGVVVYMAHASGRSDDMLIRYSESRSLPVTATGS
jgi:hypothetical protein